MGDYDVPNDLPSPPTSLHYMHQETENPFEAYSSANPMGSSYVFAFQGAQIHSEVFNESEESTPSDMSPAPSSKPKRKRENRYKNAPPSVLTRRRAQNRASQRAYRERKDQRIKDLEVLLGESQQRNDVLSHAYATLQAEYIKLKIEQENAVQIRSAGLEFDPTIDAAALMERIDMDQFVYNDPTAYPI